MDKKEKKMTRAFIMDAEIVLLFDQLVKDYVVLGHKDTPKLRAMILNEMARQGMMRAVFDTSRSEDQIVEDYKKKGLRIDDRRQKRVSGRNDRYHKRNVVGGFQRKLVAILKILFGGGSV